MVLAEIGHSQMRNRPLEEGKIATGREKLPIPKVIGGRGSAIAIEVSRIREMLEQQNGRNRGRIFAPTSQRQTLCRAFQRPNGQNLRRPFQEKGTGYGEGGKVL